MAYFSSPNVETIRYKVNGIFKRKRHLDFSKANILIYELCQFFISDSNNYKQRVSGFYYIFVIFFLHTNVLIFSQSLDIFIFKSARIK